MERSDDVANVSGRHNEMYLGLEKKDQLILSEEILITYLSTTGMPSIGQITPESKSVG